MTQMMTTPASLHGVWFRQWATIDGGVRFETQSVVWLQAGPRYADIRVPFHPAGVARCFAGRSGWDGDQYRWTHELDLEGSDSPAGDDTGHLTFVDGGVIEHGLFPTVDGPLAYEEMWVPGRASDGPWAAFAAPDACLVRAGGHAITVGDFRRWGKGFAARYLVHDAGRWVTRLSIGDTGALPDPDTSLPPDWRLVGSGHTGDQDVIPRLEQTWTP